MNKKASRRVLGRGLASLIPDASSGEKTNDQEIVLIDYSAIKPNPFQPRHEFNEEEINGLAESINAQGLLQPLLVRQKATNEYEIISGERRFKALRKLGKDKISCVIKAKVSDRDMMELSLVENIQREDLNEIEKADAYQRLLLEYNYTHDELSKQVGKSRATISNALRLLELPYEIKQMVSKKAISMGHARALLSIEDAKQQLEWAKKIVTDELSVRAIEKKAQSLTGDKKRNQKQTVKKRALDPDLNEAISRLQYKLGTPVFCKSTSDESGKIEIEYFSQKDLARIIDLLLATEEIASRQNE